MDAPPILSERLELVWLSPEFLRTLLSGDHSDAEAMAGVRFAPGWPDDERFLRMRLKQMTDDPAQGPWLVRLMTLRTVPGRPMIGHIGFHGKPDAGGMVEVGYTVLPDYRRQGYAFEAVQALFGWATREHGITRFRASVSPRNEPSLNLVRKLGMRQTGRHWDEEDGEELEFELERPPRPPSENEEGGVDPSSRATAPAVADLDTIGTSTQERDV